MARIEEVEVERAVKEWLKRCAEHNGYSVAGIPTLTSLAGNQGAFGQTAVNYLATITIRGSSEPPQEIAEAMLEVPPDGFKRATGRPEDQTTFHFRLAVEP